MRRHGFRQRVPAVAQLLSDPKLVREYLYRVRWPQGFVCPRCGGTEQHPLAGRDEVQCARCRHQASITAGTHLHRVRLPPHQVYQLAYYWVAVQGTSAGLSRLASIRQPTIHALLTRFRQGLGEAFDREALAGDVEGIVQGVDAADVDGWAGPVTVRVLALQQRHDPFHARFRADEGSEPTLKFLTTALASSASVTWLGHFPYQRNTLPFRLVEGKRHEGGVEARLSELRGWLVRFRGRVGASSLQLYLDEFTFRARFQSSDQAIDFLMRALFSVPNTIARGPRRASP